MAECSICLNELIEKNTCTTGCNHKFCKVCLDEWFNSKKLSCPLCREEIKNFEYQNEKNRIVCIIQNEQQPNRRNIRNDVVFIKKKALRYLMGGLIFTSLSLTLSTYFLSTCEEF